MDAFSRLLCVQDISGFCNCSDLTAPDESYPILLSSPPRCPTCWLFVTESPAIHWWLLAGIDRLIELRYVNGFHMGTRMVFMRRHSEAALP